MAEQKTGIEVTIKTKQDASGFRAAAEEAKKLGDELGKTSDAAEEIAEEMSEAEKAAAALKAKLEALNKGIEEMGNDGDVSAEKLAKAAVALRSVQREADKAGIELADMAKASQGLDKAKNRLSDIQIESRKMGLELESMTAKMSLQDRAAEKLGVSNMKLSTSAQSVSTAFGPVMKAGLAGFAVGTLIAKKAGVDFTVTLDALNSASTTVAKGINFVVGAAFRSLGETIGLAGRQIEEDLLGPIQRAKNMVAIQEETKHLAEAAKVAAANLAKLSEITSKMGGAKTKFQANVELAEMLENIGKGGPMAASQLDVLRMRFQELRKAGASVNEVSLQFAKDNERVGDSAWKTAEIHKRSAVILQELVDKYGLARVTQEQAKAQTDKDREEILEEARAAEVQRLAEFEAYQKTMSAFLADLTKDRMAAIEAGVQHAENELKLRGATEENVEAYRAAKQAEIDITYMTAEERMAAEIELHDRLAQLRMGNVGDIQKAGDEEILLIRAKLAAILLDETISAEQRKAVSAALTDAKTEDMKREAEWAAMTESQKVSTYANAAGQLVGLARGAFGEKKEFAIADAVINTYQSATSAYNAMSGLFPAPAWGVVAAALAVAAGLANVKKIMATKPAAKAYSGTATGGGKGVKPLFDDPVNDAAARFAGRQSARDLVNHTTQGMMSELLSGRAQRGDGNTTRATFHGEPIAPAAAGGPTLIINGDVLGVPKDEFWKGARRGLASVDQRVETRVRGGRSKRVT